MGKHRRAYTFLRQGLDAACRHRKSPCCRQHIRPGSDNPAYGEDQARSVRWRTQQQKTVLESQPGRSVIRAGDDCRTTLRQGDQDQSGPSGGARRIRCGPAV